MLRKPALTVSLASTLVIASLGSAFAEPIYRGGSSTPGLIATRIPNSLGPLGIDRPRRGGHQRAVSQRGGAFYRGHEHKYRESGHWEAHTTGRYTNCTEVDRASGKVLSITKESFGSSC